MTSSTKYMVFEGTFANTNNSESYEGIDQKPENEYSFPGYLPPVSLENEVEAWDHIADIADDALDLYPSTLKEDNEIL